MKSLIWLSYHMFPLTSNQPMYADDRCCSRGHVYVHKHANTVCMCAHTHAKCICTEIGLTLSEITMLCFFISLHSIKNGLKEFIEPLYHTRISYRLLQLLSSNSAYILCLKHFFCLRLCSHRDDCTYERRSAEENYSSWKIWRAS